MLSLFLSTLLCLAFPHFCQAVRIFSALVRGKELTESELQQLRNEDDSAIVMIDGKNVEIEQNKTDFNTSEHSLFLTSIYKYGNETRQGYYFVEFEEIEDRIFNLGDWAFANGANHWVRDNPLLDDNGCCGSPLVGSPTSHKRIGITEFELPNKNEIDPNTNFVLTINAGGSSRSENEQLVIYGYIGNGQPDTTDRSITASLLDSIRIDGSSNQLFQIDITNFVADAINSEEDYIGFRFEPGTDHTAIGVGGVGLGTGAAQLLYNNKNKNKVNTTGDESAINALISPDSSDEDGVQITLRSLIQYANANDDFDEIKFAIPEEERNSNGTYTINVSRSLPTISDANITIDGAGVIELKGNTSSKIAGLIIDANDTEIKGLTINNFGGTGIYLRNGNNNTIENNKIGTDVEGQTKIANGGLGIFIESSDNMIQGNVLSGNAGSGIGISGSNNTILSNFIGTNSDGTKAIGNEQNGISIRDEGDNLIEKNIIADNILNGIEILNSSNNDILDNNIGVDANGDNGLGNGKEGILIQSSINNKIQTNIISDNELNGIKLIDNSNNSDIIDNNIGVGKSGNNALGNGLAGIYIQQSNDNKIGGENPREGNIVAFNGNPNTPNDSAGIVIESGTGNPIKGNSIFENTGLSIDLGDDGATENDKLDADIGANNLQNAPSISTVKEITKPDGTRERVIQGNFSSTPETSFRLEFFANEGKDFIDSINVLTNPQGNTPYEFSTDLDVGTIVQATATNSDTGNTSEFSSDLPCLDTGIVNLELEGGEFEDTDGDGSCEGQGTVYIGHKNGIERMLKVRNADVEIFEDRIVFSGGTVESLIGNTSIQTGALFDINELNIPIGTTGSSLLDETASNIKEVQLAGLDISFD